jgi:hypothetical protein
MNLTAKRPVMHLTGRFLFDRAKVGEPQSSQTAQGKDQDRI